MNISALITEAKKNSRAAQKCLFDLYAGRMLFICRRYVKCPEDAEECLLDGFHEFFKGLGSFIYKAEPALYAWLKKIMIYRCLMFIRKTASFDIVSGENATDIIIEDEIINKLSVEEISRVIIQLPVGYRTVFNLYEIDGFNHEDISKMMGISNATSRSQLKKAKVLLRKLLISKGYNYDKQRSNK